MEEPDSVKHFKQFIREAKDPNAMAMVRVRDMMELIHYLEDCESRLSQGGGDAYPDALDKV